MSEEDRITPAIRVGLAKSYAGEYNRERPDWRVVGETVLESSVYEYVRGNSPRNVPTEDIRIITDLMLEELKKLR